jgi:hypothetical protein
MDRRNHEGRPEMNWRNLITTTVTAAVTAAVSLALLGPGTVTANTPPQEVLQQRIRAASGEAGGLQLTLTPSSDRYDPGDRPTVTLTAYNPTGHAIRRTVQVRMTTATPAHPLARMLPMPVERYQESCELYVEAGQTRTLELDTGMELASAQLLRFFVEQGERRLAAVASAVRFDEKQMPDGPQVF